MTLSHSALVERIQQIRRRDWIDSRRMPWKTFDPPLDELAPRRPLPIGYVDAGAKNGNQHRHKDARGHYAKKREGDT